MVNGQICYREYDHIYKAVIDGVCLDKEPALCEESAKLPETCLYNFDKLCQAGQAFKDNVCSEGDNSSENNESEGNGSWSDNKEGLSDGAVAGIVVGVVIVVALVVGLLVFFLVSKKKKEVVEAAVESVIGEDAAKVVTAAV